MRFATVRRAVLVAAAATMAACTVHDTNTPPLSGPSQLGLTLRVTATPDVINQDGGSQSAIRVAAIGADGRGITALPLRLDMSVAGQPGDFGTLSGRTIVTGSDGTASVVYTAPPSPSNGVFGTCNNLPGTCVDIVATPTGTNFGTLNPESVQIRLAPPGIILPPAQTPTPAFTFVPASPPANSPVQFDASTSCGAALVSGACPVTAPSITSFSWNFGDGQTASGQTTSHSFALQQSYTVTLTVTNAVGSSASRSQVISIAAGALPTATFTFSPADAAAGQQIFFSGLTSTPGSGHTIASYRWTFGDGSTGSGATVSHAYAAAGIYRVQLTVVDDAGQTATSAFTSITVGAGNTGPTAVFTYSPVSPVASGSSVTFDASPSTGTPGGTAPVVFKWQFECPASGCADTEQVTTTSGPIATHTYNLTGTFTVKLTVFDTAGRSASTTRQISVQ